MALPELVTNPTFAARLFQMGIITEAELYRSLPPEQAMLIQWEAEDVWSYLETTWLERYDLPLPAPTF